MKLEGLSCRRRVALLCAYLDRELPPSRRRVIAAHRRSCRPCAELLAGLERTVRALERLRVPAKPSLCASAALRAALRRASRP